MANLPAYNLPQSVFMISLGSNALFGEMDVVPDLLQTKLRYFLAGKTPKVAGQGPFFEVLNQPSASYPSLAAAPDKPADWCTVWGPVVYQGELNPGATNAMYVAYSKNLQTYVVGIAGTNPTGDYALFVEDLAVKPAQMVAWPPQATMADPPSLSWTGLPQPASVQSGMQPVQPMPDPAQPFIDAGTSDGITILYTMQDPETKQTLAQFLSGVTTSGQTLVFTGHSLGGALAPVLAMLLYPQAKASPGPANAGDPSLKSNWGAVYVLATAGPTPGTVGFANRFFTPPAAPVIGSVTPILTVSPPLPPPAASGPYAPVATNAPQSAATWQFTYWNMIYANSFDVVPRAWNALANLVQQPQAGQGPDYPSFFAGGSALAAATSKTDVTAPGPDAFNLIGTVKAKSGYVGDTTNYYAACLLHSPFNGSWGNWTPKSTTYPPAWIATPIVAPVASLDDLKTWILNAHLGQYAQAFLGFPCPTILEYPTPLV